MLKMLIVDDEYYSREGMKKIIDWSQYDIEIIGSAENGIQGIDMIRELHPDIVLTDIRMKAMDGLSMIEEVRKINAHCKFIIMSGYKVFEYAKKAMEEGVDFYLLKPVSKALLIDAVQTTKELLDKSKQDFILQRLQQSEGTLRSIINHKESKIDVIIKNYFICSVKLSEPMLDYQQDKLKIYNILIEQRENIQICFFSDREFIVMFCNEEDDEMTVRRMRRSLQSRLNVDIYVGVGEKQYTLADFKTAYEQACLALQYKLYDTKNDEIIFYRNIEGLNNKIDNQFIKINNEVIHAIEICEKDTVTQNLRLAHEKMVAVTYIPQDVYNWFSHLYMNITTMMKQLGFSEQEMFNTTFGNMNYNDMNSDIKLSEIFLNIENFCFHCINIVERNRKGLVSKSIKEVIAYIDKHYMKEISLEYLEKIFFMEFSYLSKLFKKETGKSYLQYLTEKRIQKAKELMGDPSLTIYEISARVSYTDSKYFSQLFKKIEGVTPKEYRMSLLEQQKE